MEYTDENKIYTEKIRCELLYKSRYIEKPNSDELYTIVVLYEKEESNKIQKKWKSYKSNKKERRLIKNIRNRETGLPFSFGKRTYKFNSDIKYLKSLK